MLQFLVDLLTGNLVLVDVPSSNLPTDAIIAENGDYFIAENGDYIIQE